MRKPKIITVGISPAWDITCCAEGLRWGDHKQLSAQTIVSAGKALNVSRALAWMGVKNTAAGLWGKDDYPILVKSFNDPLIKLELSAVSGLTRHNITLIDTKSNKEMHLRAPDALASQYSLNALNKKLNSIVRSENIVVFSGSLPDGFEKQLFAIFRNVVRTGAKLVIDTSSPVYRSIIHAFPIFLIKPNLDELRHLIGNDIKDSPAAIVKAARCLCDSVEIVVVSRGEKGAVLITKDKAFSCYAVNKNKAAVKTVGCGDFLLAGLLANISNPPQQALAYGIKAAAARAWNMYPNLKWGQVQKLVGVKVENV